LAVVDLVVDLVVSPFLVVGVPKKLQEQYTFIDPDITWQTLVLIKLTFD
jgi:hypothetical protein